MIKLEVHAKGDVAASIFLGPAAWQNLRMAWWHQTKKAKAEKDSTQCVLSWLGPGSIGR